MDESIRPDVHGRRDTLTDQVAVERRLAELLRQPEMKPGVRLPTERSLAGELNVPRNAVRRALAQLESQGQVVRIIGSGTYVANKPGTSARGEGLVGRKDYSPREIMEARMLLEPRFAALIVMHANKSDMEAIRDAMREADRSTDFVTFEHWDGQFHQMLAQATHNSLIIDLFQIVTLSRDTAEWGELKKGSITAERRELYCQEHAKVFDALQARNARLAEKAIETHLVTVRQNLFGL